jgi:hypothetical protein
VGTAVIVGKPVNHISTAAACETCHTSTTTPGGFATWMMNHTGITTGCANCHASGSTFYDVAMVTLSPTLHVPVGSTACESCHSATSTSTGGFSTGWAMGAAGHALVSTATCASCHDTGNIYSGVVTKPVSHIAYAAGMGCDSCHTASNTNNYTTFLGGIFSHAGITTGCASCHNGTTALGKPATHIATTAPCESCHTSTVNPGGFATWTMNHTGITSGCASCHNGATVGTTVVMGKPSTHIATTLPCENCHTSTVVPGGFATWTMNHTGITSGCASCHNGSPSSTVGSAVIVGKPTTHISTSVACETCHTSTLIPGGFAFWTMNHTGITTGCASCHATGSTFYDVTMVTLSPTVHVPVGSASCESCHSATSTSTGGFSTGWTMGAAGHAFVSSTTCATCHDTGATYTGVVTKLPIHITYTAGLGCDSCHTASNTSNYTTFLGAGFNHAGITTGCASCHNGTTALGKPTTHIPTTAPCENCHTSTASFLGAIFSHTGITTGCASCHSGQYSGVTVQPATHIPTTAACENCHTSTVTPGGFATWTMNHSGAGIASGCATCHSTGKTFYDVTMVTQSATVHVPVGSIACESCHSTTSTSTGGFATGWTMGAAGHALVSATTCATCHNTGVPYTGVATKLASHFAYTAGTGCDSCHTASNTSNYTTFLGASYNHAGITTGCASCHSGQYAGVMVQPATHIPTASACENCHTTTTSGGFATWTMNHAGAGIASGCATCHSTGKTFYDVTMVTESPTIHVPVGSIACESCHSTTSTSTGGFATGWAMGAAGHALVSASTCATCHNTGVAYTGVTTKIANHFPYTATMGCDSCHTASNTSSYTTFLGATYNHTGITTGCASCHSGQYAGVTVQPSTHIPTTSACETCHTSTVTPGGFATWTMNHSGAGITSGCATCHGTGKTFYDVTMVTESPTVHVPVGSLACESCHSTTSTSTGGFATGWTMGAAGHALVSATTCATCHDLGTAFTGVVTRLSTHIAYTAGTSCGSCHTSSNTSGYTTFLGATFTHTGITTGCASCHNGTIAMGQPATHIPTTLPCENCHTSTVDPGGFATWTMNHTGITTGCASCHGTGKTFYDVTMVTESASIHVPVGSTPCESCHSASSTSTGGFATSALPMGSAGHTAVLAATPLCGTCHGTSGSAYTGVVTIDAAHIKGYPTEDCGVCHTASNTGSYSVGGFTTAVMTGLPGHTGIVLCNSCHNGTYSWIKSTSSFPGHVAIGTADCSTCHTPANTGSYTSFLGAAGGHAMTAAQAAGTCANAGCHANGGTGKMYVSGTHIPVPGVQCDQCHTTSFATLSFLTATMNHTVVPTTCGATCHNGSYTTQGNVAGAQSKTTITNHIPTTITGTLECNTCHTGTPVISSSGWASGEKMNHNALQTGCYVCHLTGSTYLAAGIQRMNHNGASAAKDCSSTSCHKPLGKTGSPYSSWD